MSACPSIESLRNWLQESNLVETGPSLDAHVEACLLCQAIVARLLGPPALTGTSPNQPPVPTAPREELLLRLEAMGTAATRGIPPAGAHSPPSIEGCEVLRELGRGGMGVVYLARQTALKRLVAVKVVLAGEHAGPVERARFHTEAEAVARLQHPNIVQVYQIGECDGRPYLFLEYAEGGSLDRRLAGVPLPASEAAALIETLARAMQAAHEKGIVHRDLKPGNVLLTADGVAKITDFGLARKLDEASQTQTGAVMGTPSYMAPEQATGRKGAGPVTDVYALGAILYECLTGRPPFKAATSFETLEQVVTQEPVPPRQLNGRAPADLETICLKCLHKEPQRRYASAVALAEDLRRFQSGEAIEARPVGRAERLARLCRRRPLVAGLTGLVAALALALAIGGPVLALRERRAREQAELNESAAIQSAAEAERRRTEAEANYRLAKQAVDETLGLARGHPLFTRPVLSPDLQQVRRLLLEKALPFYLNFRTQRPDDFAALHDTWEQHFKVGLIHQLLGDSAEAQKQFEEAERVIRQLVQQRPNEPRLRDELAQTLSNLGGAHFTRGRRGEALARYEEAMRMRRELVKERGGTARDRAALARALNNLGIVQHTTGPHQAAQKSFTESIALARGLIRDQPRDPDHRALLAATLTSFGRWYRDLGRLKEAAPYDAEAVALYRALVQAHPGDLDHLNGLALALTNLGVVQTDLRLGPQALAATHESVTALRALVKAQPTVPQYRSRLALALNNLGPLYRARGQTEEALKCYTESAELGRELVKEQPRVPSYLLGLTRTLMNLGNLHSALRQPDKAIAHFSEGAQWGRALLALHDAPEPKHVVAALHYNLAYLLSNQGKDRAGLRHYTEAIVLLRQAVKAAPAVPDYRAWLVRALTNRSELEREQGQFRKAREDMDEALTVLTRLRQDQPKFPELAMHFLYCYEVRAHALSRLGEHRAAVADWDRALPLAPPQGRSGLRTHRAVDLAKSGDADGATAEADALATTQLPPGALYDLARVFALGAAGAHHDRARPLPLREQVVERRARRAVALLRRAAATGHFRQPAALADLHKSPDFDFLRERADFRAFVAERGALGARPAT